MEARRRRVAPAGRADRLVDGLNLYLEPEASYAAAQRQGRDSGDALSIAGRTLRKRLQERKMLLSVDDNREVLTVRRTLGGSRKGVLHVSSGFLSTHNTNPDQPDHETKKTHTNADPAPPLWSGQRSRTRPAPDREPGVHPKPEQEPDPGADGRVSGEHRSGNGREPDRGPDQQEPLAHAENAPNGRVGRVVESGRDKGGGEGARAGRIRRGRI